MTKSCNCKKCDRDIADPKSKYCGACIHNAYIELERELAELREEVKQYKSWVKMRPGANHVVWCDFKKKHIIIGALPEHLELPTPPPTQEVESD